MQTTWDVPVKIRTSKSASTLPKSFKCPSPSLPRDRNQSLIQLNIFHLNAGLILLSLQTTPISPLPEHREICQATEMKHPNLLPLHDVLLLINSHITCTDSCHSNYNAHQPDLLVNETTALVAIAAMYPCDESGPSGSKCGQSYTWLSEKYVPGAMAAFAISPETSACHR
jgi:hypothetical protein